ncbi:hypothetical protein B0H10DRAFT_2428241 [Mycena sp. CBHHK59/15]|nr:hypothetical protein B0H10DRAFT_2428241 [Mycena sp. CBHHK59/15]
MHHMQPRRTRGQRQMVDRATFRRLNDPNAPNVTVTGYDACPQHPGSISLGTNLDKNNATPQSTDLTPHADRRLWLLPLGQSLCGEDPACGLEHLNPVLPTDRKVHHQELRFDDFIKGKSSSISFARPASVRPALSASSLSAIVVGMPFSAEATREPPWTADLDASLTSLRIVLIDEDDRAASVITAILFRVQAFDERRSSRRAWAETFVSRIHSAGSPSHPRRRSGGNMSVEEGK